MKWILPTGGRSCIGRQTLEAEGVTSLDQTRQRDCRAAGRDQLSDLSWYFVDKLFRMVGIFRGVKKRVADGNASSSEGGLLFAKIGPLAKEAWDQARIVGEHIRNGSSNGFV